MKLNDVSFPYPVLGIHNDILPELGDNCLIVEAPKVTPRDYIFEINVELNNPDIQGLIESGDAEFSCEVDCAKTFLHFCKSGKEPHFTIVVSRKDLVGRITFSLFVSVKKSIKDYHNSGFHEDYAGLNFDLVPGDVLAIFGTAYYDADIKYDKLQTAGSFMHVCEGVGRSYTYYDISGNSIDIYLPSPLFAQYRDSLGNGFASIFHSSIAFNALLQALYNINPDDGAETRTWAKSILYRINTEEQFATYRDWDPDKFPEIAQVLLGDPYNRLFGTLLNMDNSEE